MSDIRPIIGSSEPVGDMPDGITINGHLFVHVAACPCPRVQAEVKRLEDDQWEPREGERVVWDE